MERITWIDPAFDKRHPEPAKNYGIKACHINFVLKGELGAVSYAVGTDWYLKDLQEGIRRRDAERGWFDTQPQSWLLGYHSPTPRYEGQEPHGPCEWLDGKDCYSDGWFLMGERVRDRLLIEGDKGVWAELEAYYAETFGELR